MSTVSGSTTLTRALGWCLHHRPQSSVFESLQYAKVEDEYFMKTDVLLPNSVNVLPGKPRITTPPHWWSGREQGYLFRPTWASEMPLLLALAAETMDVHLGLLVP